MEIDQPVRYTAAVVYWWRALEPSRNAREATLLQAFRRLPLAAAELTALAERLAALRADAKIDWSDSWSDEDLKEFTDASARRLEAEEPEERR
jgi:hypothetical protein